jgi:hypothetical protein
MIPGAQLNTDILPHPSDILLLSVVITSGAATVTVTRHPDDSELFPKSRHSNDFGARVGCLHHEFYTVYLDTSDSTETVRLGVDKEYTGIHSD